MADGVIDDAAMPAQQGWAVGDDRSAFNRPIGELPIMRGSWWTTTTPRPAGYVEPASASSGAGPGFMGAPGEALGRLAERQAQLEAQAAPPTQADYITPWAVKSEPMPIQAWRGAPGPALRQPMATAPQPRPVTGGGMAVGGMAGGGLRQPSSLDYVAEQLRQQGAQVGAEGQYQLAVTGIEAQQQAQIAEAEAQAQRQREQALQEFQARQAQYEADQAKRQREVEELSADVAATKIDPGNYFSQQPAWAKVLSLLSVAVGGFAQGYTRGQLRNTALDMMNDAIARDIDAQKANLASKRASVAEKQSLYAQARQKFGDDQSAYLFADARMSEATANAARRFAAEARGAEQKERATMIAQTFEAKAKESDAKVGELFARQREAAAAAAARAAAGPTLAQQEQLARIAKTKAETRKIAAEAAAESGVEGVVVGKKANELQARYVPALGMIAGSPKQAEDLNEGLAAVDRTKQVLGEMKRLRTDGYTGGFGLDAARYDALRTDAIASSNRAAKLGALDQGTLQLLERSIPESALFSSDAKAAAKLDAAAQALDVGRAAQIRNTPLIPAQMVATPQGPAFQFTPGQTSGPTGIKPR